MTEAVARQAADGANIEPVGVRMLRGVEQPLSLYRLRHDEERRDPVCGKTVAAPPAAQLRQGEEEAWFCSQACLRDFLTREKVET
jgi:YHS domain-containing protein